MSEADGVFLPATNDDYQHWVQQHPRAYVINAHKTGGVSMYWHRADCGHIAPDGMMRFIGGDYIKACALDPGPLAVWAKSRHESLNYCKSCQWQWDKEYGTEMRTS